MPSLGTGRPQYFTASAAPPLETVNGALDLVEAHGLATRSGAEGSGNLHEVGTTRGNPFSATLESASSMSARLAVSRPLAASLAAHSAMSTTGLSGLTGARMASHSAMSASLAVARPLAATMASASSMAGELDVPARGWSATGAFNTGTGTSEISITGLPGEPKLLLLFTVGRTETVDAVGGRTHLSAFGMASAPAERCTVGMSAEDGADTTATRRWHRDDACLALYSTASVLDGLLDVVSFDEDGFTLVPDDAFAESYRVAYLAIGGVGVDAHVGRINKPASTGDFDVTDPGFDPDGVFFMGVRSTSNPPSVASDNSLDIGAADDAGNQVYVGVNSLSGKATSTTSITMDDGKVQLLIEFESMLPTGFRLSSEFSSALRIYYAAITGVSFRVGDISTRTDGNDIVETGGGFQPFGGVFLFNGMPNYDSQANANRLGVGFASSPSERVAMAVFDNNNQAVSQVATTVQHDAIYARISNSDAIEGLMDLVSWDADGFTAVMDDADPSARLVPYVLIG